MRTTIVLALLSIGLHWNTACAQQPTDTLQLPEHSVHATEITVPESFKKTVLDSNAFQSAATASLGEALANNAGIYLKTYGQGSLATPSLRGTAAGHTQLYWNGFALNSPLLGLSDLTEMPVALNSSIELHHGLSSLTDGSGGLGGSIQLNSFSDFSGRDQLSIIQRIASFDDYRTVVKAHIGNKKWSGTSSAAVTTAQNSFQYINPAVEGRPLERQSHAAFQQLAINQELYRAIGKSVIAFRGQATSMERQLPKLITAQSSLATQADAAARAMLEWTRYGATRITVRSGYLWHEQLYDDPTADIAGLYREASWMNRLYASREVGKRWHFWASGEADVISGQSSGWSGEIGRNRAAAVVKTTCKITSRLSADVLLRQEWLDDTFLPPMPSLGANYKVGKGRKWQLKSNIARSYRVAALNDLYWEPGGNPNLAPESGWATELGVCYGTERKARKWSGESTIYYSRIDDWIQWVPTSNALWSATNFKEVESYGVESRASLSTSILQWKIKAQVAHTYTHAAVIDSEQIGPEPAGNRLIYVPAHTATGSVHVARSHYWMRINGTYNSKVFITSDNSWFMPAIPLLACSVGSRLWKHPSRDIGITWYAAVNNLFNRQYQTIPWRPMPGRWFSASIQFSWANS